MSFPVFDLPADSEVFGIVRRSSGALISKTIMFSELSRLLETTEERYRESVVEDNILMKRTQAGRRETFNRLRQFYGLNYSLLLFVEFKKLWQVEEERPLLALLLATARDPLLRTTAQVVLNTPQGVSLSSAPLAEAVAAAYPGRYSVSSLGSMSRNALSSWTQSGHLSDTKIKLRKNPKAGPASVTFALLLGYCCGARGAFLFTTAWAALLELPAHQWDDLTFASAQRGWLDYHRIGDVVEITFPWLEEAIK